MPSGEERNGVHPMRVLRDGLDPVRVLIADDDETYRSFVKRILQMNLNVSEIAEAADCEEAVQVARQVKPEVVLMDLDLPGENGLEVTRRLKTELHGVRVILLSTTGGEAVRNAAVRCGADVSMRKDVEISQLLSTIRHTAEAA
jgi:DNA-binding NarL/FixJ family response regulator